MSMWTQELMGRLRQLHDQGLSFSRIAREMNAEFGLALTANACIGKARRANFPLRHKVPPPRRASTKPRKAPPPRMVTVVKRPVLPPGLIKEVSLPPVMFSEGGGVELSQLTAHVCHWPSGAVPPYVYCGLPAHLGSPFCSDHYELAYIKPAKRWR